MSEDPYEDIVGLNEVAEELRIPISRLRRWIELRKTTRCPKPVRVLQMGSVYSMIAWRDWYMVWQITRAAGRRSLPRTASGIKVTDGYGLIERLAARAAEQQHQQLGQPASDDQGEDS